MSIYRKCSKVVVALVLCFALVLMPFSFSVSAYDANTLSSNPGLLSQRFAAWVAAAISAISISLDAVSAPVQDLTNFIADPFNVVYTYGEQQLYDYLDLNTISITPNGTIIDGVVYDDVWISSDASNKFRTNAFDFQTAYNIASNSNGTFASGVGFLDGVPLYSVDGLKRSQSVTISGPGTYTLFDAGALYTCTVTQSGSKYNALFYRDGVRFGPNPYSLSPSYYPLDVFLRSSSDNSNFLRAVSSAGPADFALPSYSLINSPFDFDYVSGTIPPSTVIPSDQGLLIHVPHHSGSTHTDSFFDDFLTDYPVYSEPGGVDIDLNLDPDMSLSLDDLADILIPIINIIKSEIAPQPVTPSPTYTNIADTNYSILNNTLQNIEDWLSEISSGIQAIPSAIGNLIDGFLNDIEIGPIKVFDKALDLIQSLFAPVFLLIRNGLSIWSYVVTWVNTLSAPLSFIVAVLPSAVWLPVYALVAGTICLAIFRRFGK